MATQHEMAAFAEYRGIAATIERYIDGARRGDIDLMNSAFFPEAHIQGSYGGKPVNWTLEEFCDVVRNGGSASDLEAMPVTIEWSGTAAMVRLEAQNWRGTRYTDFFVLLYRDGRWRITSKAFFSHSTA
jgi:hypothetical protein